MADSQTVKAAEDKVVTTDSKEAVKETSQSKAPRDKDKKSDEKSDSKKEVETKKEGSKFPELKPGMTVKIYQKIKEINLKGEEKERVQFFEGIIIAKKHGKETGGTITVRKISNGVGVEKIYPLNLPTLEKIEVKKIAKVSRAKLFFLQRGYKKRLKETVVAK